jgi:hypothetical protein
MRLGDDGFSEPWNGAIGDVLIYDAVLTLAELENTRQTRMPRRTANLNTSLLGLHDDDVTDWISGNGRTWTLTGAIPLTDPFPLAWGTASPLFMPAPVAAGGSATGTGAMSIPAITALGSGIAAHKGTGTPSIPLPTSAGSGIASHKGSGTPSVPAFTAAGTGRDSTMRGTGSLSVTVTGAGIGIASHVGTGAMSIPAITAAATGARGPAGSGAASIPLPTMSGTGIASHPGSGAMSIPAVTLAGTGRDGTVTGTGAMSIPRPTSTGVGVASHKGSGAMSIPAITSAGTGYGSGLASPLGSGALFIPAITMAGIGVQTAISLRLTQANSLLRQELASLRDETLKVEAGFRGDLEELRERIRELERRERRGITTRGAN